MEKKNGCVLLQEPEAKLDGEVLRSKPNAGVPVGAEADGPAGL